MASPPPPHPRVEHRSKTLSRLYIATGTLLTAILVALLLSAPGWLSELPRSVLVIAAVLLISGPGMILHGFRLHRPPAVDRHHPDAFQPTLVTHLLMREASKRGHRTTGTAHLGLVLAHHPVVVSTLRALDVDVAALRRKLDDMLAAIPRDVGAPSEAAYRNAERGVQSLQDPSVDLLLTEAVREGPFLDALLEGFVRRAHDPASKVFRDAGVTNHALENTALPVHGDEPGDAAVDLEACAVVLHDDDETPFDVVIDALITTLDIDDYRAVELTTRVDFEGSASVWTGSAAEARTLARGIRDRARAMGYRLRVTVGRVEP